MIPVAFEIRAVALTDPHPPAGDLDPNRQVLIVQILATSPVAPPSAILIPGEGLPQLIDLLQKVCTAHPGLTTERAAKEGTALSSENVDGMRARGTTLVPGPEGEQ